MTVQQTSVAGLTAGTEYTTERMFLKTPAALSASGAVTWERHTVDCHVRCGTHLGSGVPGTLCGMQSSSMLVSALIRRAVSEEQRPRQPLASSTLAGVLAPGVWVG